MQAENRRRILIVGQLTSVHLSRWVSSINPNLFEVHLYGSGGNNWVHPELDSLLGSQGHRLRFTYSPGQLRRDFWLSKFEKLIGANVFRAVFLYRFARKRGFDMVHFLDFQTAAYLMTPFSGAWKKSRTVMAVSNWGSDIYWYGKKTKHDRLIRKVLETAHFYSAECDRDIALARECGFRGNASKILNGGGVHVDRAHLGKSNRTTILIKGYQDVFGEAEEVLEMVVRNESDFQGFEVVFVSAAKSLVRKILLLPKDFPVDVKFHSYSVNRYSLGASEVSALFAESRLFIAKSKSDGASTMAIEALAHGCIPIQSPTSCLSEYLTPDLKEFQPKSNSSTDFVESIRAALRLSAAESERLAFEGARLAESEISRGATSARIEKFYLEALQGLKR